MTSVVALDELAAALTNVDDLDIERSVPAAQLCTYRVGGPIDVVARVHTEAALDALLAAALAQATPVLAIGKGSNLLVADAGFDGVGILLDTDFTSIDIDGLLVRAGAAAALPVVARATVASGLTNFEWAVGVPGTIGGAVRMNAGGHGSDMAASLVDVEIADLRTGTRRTEEADALGLGYRRSGLAATDLVTSARLKLSKLEQPSGVVSEEPSSGADLLKEIVRWRRENQPGGQNAGSVFTNPPGDSAGRLIDQTGLRGLRIGSAEVSTKHANFIQADADGRADDVMSLMLEIVHRVESAHGVRLHAETRLLGFAHDVVDQVQATNPKGRESDG